MELAKKQLKELIKCRDQFNEYICILENQIQKAEIKNCKGILEYYDNHKDNYVYICNTCQRKKIFVVEPENLKCNKNL